MGGKNQIISQTILNSITAHGNTLDSGISYAGIQLFTNGVNTRTQGVEATGTYTSDFDDWGSVNWTAGLNYNETAITRIAPLPASDVNVSISQTALLSRNATSSLTSATPKFKLILGGFWSLDAWSVNLQRGYLRSHLAMGQPGRQRQWQQRRAAEDPHFAGDQYRHRL